MQAPSIKRFTALCVLMAAPCASSALTLGPVQGRPVLGRPLDVRVALQFSVQDDPKAACMTAAVAYGDTVLETTKVSTQILALGLSDKASHVVRINTTVPVDEPVVSIDIRAGCQETLSRQYLLLADANATPAAKNDAVQLPAPATKKTRSGGPARLTLSPIDLTVDNEPTLRATSEMMVAPAEDAQKRAEAVMWWKALNASPESLMQKEQALQRMQAQRKDLNAINAANTQGLAALADKTRQAEDERYANALVYSLLGMLLVVLVAIGWAWRQLRKAPDPNWAGSLYGPDSVVEGANPAALPAAQLASPVTRAVKVDLDLDQMGLVAPPSTPAPSAPQRRRATPGATVKAKPTTAITGTHRPSGFSNSAYSMDRAIESEEVLNAREQAAFFMALGQSHRAIEVLANRIEQIGESSPLVGLDLLNIYHAEERRDDFEFMRQEFMRWFAVRIPPFESFKSQGQSLESYPQIVRKIVALWPTPPVLEYIEACVYQRADEGDSAVFDLQAYLDLLLLYGVAKRLVRLATNEQDATTASELLRFRPRTTDTETPQAPDDSTSPRMRTPVVEPSVEPVDETAKHKGLTDFGFLHLH